MSPIFQFIVKPKGGTQYITEKKIKGRSLITASSIEDAFDVNKVGVIVETPIGYEGDIRIGDEIIVHHNMFRDYYSQNGSIKHSKQYFRDDLYLINWSEIFMFKSNESQWRPHVDFCILKPSNEPLKGTVIYSNETSLVNKEVGFTTESEYEVFIDGEMFYRMRNKDICINYSEGIK
jgi:hypothetical protein